MKILYIAPLRDFSGYGAAARDYVRALDLAGADIVTRSLTYDGGTSKQLPKELELSKKNIQNVDVVIQHTTPNESERLNGVFNVNYFAWETDRVPLEWVNQINQMDLALVPCSENIKAARRCGVTIPIEKVPHTFDIAKYEVVHEPFDVEGSENKFKFLAICQISKKKGLDALLKAYFAEFRSKENVTLILKVYYGPQDTDEHRQKMVEQITKIRELLRIGDYCKVNLVHAVLEEDVIGRLYSTANCYVLPSRGEGWGIPHFDAMGFGLPPIALGWGGPTEFITKDTGWLTNYTMSPCFDMPHPHPFMYTGLDNWAEPDIADLRKAMRQAYSEWQLRDKNNSWQSRISACKERVKDFSYEKVGKDMFDKISHYYNIWRKNGH